MTLLIEIKKDAVLDANQKEVLSRIAIVCGDNHLTITRGHSTPPEQLDIIAHYAAERGVSFPEFLSSGPVDLKKNLAGVGLVYQWQRTWSRLLHLGVVVNPPLPAICLDDYTRLSGEKMKGKIIRESAHISGQKNGCWPIDFSARVDGVVNFELVRNILEEARISNAGIQDIKIEHGNGCVHINTLKVI